MIRQGSIVIDAFFNTGGRLGAAIGSAYIPLGPGLTALYGLNGAGKSLLLEGLEETLTGKKSDRSRQLSPRLQIHIGEESFTPPDNSTGGSVDGRGVLLYEQFSPHGDPFEDRWIWGPFTLDWIFDRAVSVTIEQAEWLSVEPTGKAAEQVVREVFRQGRFTLEAAGTTEPAWRAEPVAQRSEESPLSGALMDLLDLGISTLGEHDRELLLEPVGSLKDPVPPSSSGDPRLYRLNTLAPWGTGKMVFQTMGLRGFDADAATRELLGQGDFWKAFTDDEALPGGFIGDARSAAQGHVVGLPARGDSPWVMTDSDGSLVGDCGLAWCVRFLESRANGIYARLLVDAPILTLQLGSPTQWAQGNPPSWVVKKSNSSGVPLSQLSDAERRWATIAIDIALALEPGGFLLVDEPERALHRSAEAFMARGLAEIAAERGLAVVAATHSPELLDAPNAHVYLVRRSEQGLLEGQQVHPLDGISKEQLSDFGLLPSDLLRRQRGFLFVEGQHDLIVLGELLGREIEDLRIEILPMRGAGRLASTLDSQVLYDFTDAHMFIMLDALRADEVTAVWNEAVRLAKTGDMETAIHFTNTSLKGLKIDEADALAAFLTRAIEQDLAERHTPLTLSAPDVLEYLPVQGFVPSATSWQELHEELDRSAGSPQSGSKFKRWLASAKKADLSDASIRRVCQGMDHIPTEFTAHLDRMREILNAH